MKKQTKKADEFAQRYDPKEAEPRIQKFWEQQGIFKFNPRSRKHVFSIDTPPPYPSGDFHIGNVLNWNYFDFAARYKRMRGFNVFFPQGWDVHGLPTEVKVEQKHKVKSSEIPREKWVGMCEEWTEENIKKIRDMMNKFGFSIDWSTEYKTSDQNYMKMVQLSFLDLRDKGLLYRGKHPINWCTRCETAIADAEVEYTERKTKLNFLKFKLAGEGEIVIATTRPEMLHACVAVAVHPEDERYKNIIGRRAIVPIFGQEVEIFASEDVDPAFGTGIVMICTFGDKQDVDWVFKHNLPIIDAIDEKGRIINAGKISGKSIGEARNEIIEELKNGSLLEQKDMEQNVGICWRCKHPIEILNKEQWFIAVTKLNENVIAETKKVKWMPDHMKLRQINWAQSMDWDWVISRQKVYGTPLPVWYCKKCRNIVFAEPEKLPVDPTKDKPLMKNCEKCGGEFFGETDTMDTWMDSSLTIAFHAGWPDKFNKKLYPTDLQPNGTDIIRTWDYYLMARHLALFGSYPYRTVLINGMVMGEDGRKMSKSLGNFVTAQDALEKSCADALRFWSALGGSTGTDIPFSWKEVNHGLKFITKLWNIAKFSSLHFENKKVKKEKLSVIDKWILTKLQKLIENSSAALEEHQFNIVLTNIENFIWHEFADNYLEIVKYRLYGTEEKEAVIYALYHCLLSSIKLLAPFMPFITEEIYQKLFRKKFHQKEKSISLHISEWPKPDSTLIDTEAEETGELAKQIISALRQYKSSRQMPLNAELKRIIIECDAEVQKRLESVAQDIKGTMKVGVIEFGKTLEFAKESEIALDKMKINVFI